MKPSGALRKGSLALLMMACLSSAASLADDDYYDLPPPGKRIDIGGFQLHLFCLGNGAPSVVLDAGLGDWSSHWLAVQKLAARHTKVCAYDRAGYGWSDPGPRPRSSGRIATELHALLEKAGIPPPYLLVGHSFGGFNVRLFATQYPEDVAGVILVDASHPGSIPYRRDESASESTPTIPNYLLLMQPIVEADTSKLDPDAIAAVWNNLLHTKSLATSRAEYRGMALSVSQVQQSPGLGDIPLTVISRGKREGGASAEDDLRENAWQAEQQELLRLSRHSHQIMARDSGHQIPLDQPELVAEAIRDLIAQQRATPAISTP